MSERVDILLAEDNASDAELIVKLLTEDGVPRFVHVVHDGEEALDFVTGKGVYAGRPFDPPRVILLDVSMPKISGFGVLKTLKSDPRTAAIPIVMLTSSNVERDVIRGYRLGANSYVQKPMDFTRFREVVQSIARYWTSINEPAPRGAYVASEDA